ncbi:MAG: pantoate--beta-alanine ligase [Verrucomicrobia bacterium]|nr:pantoate--beta-alanine ligase [Verrucomicrobiota bacterium]MDE3098844.1 pantoate--beta-alanine ligase [Verrucomicrobiota bacterium]
MHLISSIRAMQRLAANWRRAGVSIAFVPTMGCLHDGHLTLVRQARKRIGQKGRVVVSIYVNPTQFGAAEDFTTYPRTLKRDLKLCRETGVDAVFAPNDEEMYPGHRGTPSRRLAATQNFSTFVVEEELSQTMEGASRPGHFRGVTTVVAKLFNIVQPDVAVFGQKDFQQAVVIRRMAANLNFPVQIVVAPTVREPDGLAMSSRNRHLAGNLRRQAPALWRAIQRAQSLVRRSGSIPAPKLKAELKKLMENEPDTRLDYVEFFDPETLKPIGKVRPGTHVALAVFVGKTRLIDNERL